MHPHYGPTTHPCKEPGPEMGWPSSCYRFRSDCSYSLAPASAGGPPYVHPPFSEMWFMFTGKSQFVTSQHFQNVTGKSQSIVTAFFGAFCMFKSHQLCLCETQYLSVITMKSIILQFVKKGTTTWCSITQQNTNSLLGSADYNTCMIQYMYDEYWKRVKMLHCPHASGWWMNISFTWSWVRQLLSSILL